MIVGASPPSAGVGVAVACHYLLARRSQLHADTRSAHHPRPFLSCNTARAETSTFIKSASSIWTRTTPTGALRSAPTASPIRITNPAGSASRTARKCACIKPAASALVLLAAQRRRRSGALSSRGSGAVRRPGPCRLERPSAQSNCKSAENRFTMRCKIAFAFVVIGLFTAGSLAAADKYTGPVPPKPDIPYLLHASTLVETEVAQRPAGARRATSTPSPALHLPRALPSRNRSSSSTRARSSLRPSSCTAWT